MGDEYSEYVTDRGEEAEWEDPHGRRWQTHEGHPIPLGAEAGEGTRAQLTDFEQIEKFALAGNATLTLVSLRTGKRYTFKVRKPDDWDATRPIWFVSVLRGADNENDFGYIGQIRMRGAGYFYETGRKCWNIYKPASAAFEWFWRRVQLADEQSPQDFNLEVWHEGKCGRCGRKLTVPESIAAGFGPECVEMV